MWFFYSISIHQSDLIILFSDGYTVRDVVMYWTPTPVVGVEDAELPQFSIIKYETKDRMEELATGKLAVMTLFNASA